MYKCNFESHTVSKLIVNKNKKINLLGLSNKQMRLFFENLGEKSFHADQVMKWIYHYLCDNFDDMTNISKELKKKLKYVAEIYAPKIIDEKHSIDGTIKWTVSVGKQQHIETVYIPEGKRNTICISSQVGCILNCKFCATAQQGFNRNLNVSEIIGQIWLAAKVISNKFVNKIKPITNVVMMGMGEPLLNFNNIIQSIEIMLDNYGFGLSKRRVTLSTSGITPAIYKLSKLTDISLAISLHAPNNKIRNELVPINKKYNIENFLNAVNHYLKLSNSNRGRRLTIEYVMLNKVNDKIEHAHELAKLLKEIPCKINLIPWNPFLGAPYSCSSNKRINLFLKILTNYGFMTIVRKNRGKDINAACGQLVGKILHVSSK